MANDYQLIHSRLDVFAVLVAESGPGSILGGALVIAYSLRREAGAFHQGDIALLGSVVSAAIGYAVGGKLAKEMGGWQVICWALVISLPFIALPAWAQLPIDITAAPPHVWFGFFYLALVSQLLAFFLWNKGLAMGGVARVSQVQLIQPFVTIVASAFLIQEAIDTVTILFALLVVSTVAIGARMPIVEKNSLRNKSP